VTVKNNIMIWLALGAAIVCIIVGLICYRKGYSDALDDYMLSHELDYFYEDDEIDCDDIQDIHTESEQLPDC
jgi:hypothetical protein